MGSPIAEAQIDALTDHEVDVLLEIRQNSRIRPFIRLAWP
jgi:hypothetical protein